MSETVNDRHLGRSRGWLVESDNMPARPQSARSEASSSCASSTAWSPPDDRPKFVKPPPRLSARPSVPAAAAFRMKESLFLGGSLAFKLAEDRAVHRFQEHIGVDRKRRSEVALDPGKYDIPTMGRLPRQRGLMPKEQGWHTRGPSGLSETRGHSPFPTLQRWTKLRYESTLLRLTASPSLHAIALARRSPVRVTAYCVHAPSRGGPDFGTYNFCTSSFEKPRPSLSRSMRVVISRTATGEFMPVEAQKPVEAKKTYGIGIVPRSADQRKPRAATNEPPRARPASARA